MYYYGLNLWHKTWVEIISKFAVDDPVLNTCPNLAVVNTLLTGDKLLGFEHDESVFVSAKHEFQSPAHRLPTQNVLCIIPEGQSLVSNKGLVRIEPPKTSFMLHTLEYEDKTYAAHSPSIPYNFIRLVVKTERDCEYLIFRNGEFKIAAFKI